MHLKSFRTRANPTARNITSPKRDAQKNIDENYKRVGVKRLHSLWQLTLDYGIDHYENEISWLEKTLPVVRKLPQLALPKR